VKSGTRGTKAPFWVFLVFFSHLTLTSQADDHNIRSRRISYKRSRKKSESFSRKTRRLGVCSSGFVVSKWFCSPTPSAGSTGRKGQLSVRTDIPGPGEFQINLNSQQIATAAQPASPSTNGESTTN
jgi:hypothetical protein